MKISLSLIRSFLKIDVPLETICDTLTLLGLEVDGVINPHPPFAKVIVGEVIEVNRHPQAEKLQIAQVQNGKEKIQVVCGAPNCKAGMKTAFAQVGSVLTDSQGKVRTIEHATIRGVESFGMLCSSEELNLKKDGTNGIMELPSSWENGLDLVALLWDPVLEISLTPNLGHCLSALGIARELAAALQKEIHIPKIHCVEEGIPIEKKVKVIVENPQECPIYMGRVIQGIQVKPSPFWLQKELLACGMKPICNIVDATNFIMLKKGQPLHAFDLDLLSGDIVVSSKKTARDWTALDGQKKEIVDGILTISDAEKVLAVAGVMGGENGKVENHTKNIFLEAAFFNPALVRSSAKKTSLRTESAIRFEKGVDPQGIASSLDEAAMLIVEIAGGSIAQGKISLQSEKFQPKKIRLRPERAGSFLGVKLSQTEIESLLSRLECKIVHREEKTLTVEIPSYRFDLHEEVCLIEEIARLYGYNNIPRAPARSVSSFLAHDSAYLFEQTIRKKCALLGLQEFVTANLISPKLAELYTEQKALRGFSFLKTLHAKTEEYSILRPSLLPGLLQVAKENISLKNHSFSAFEIGRVHFLQNHTAQELPMLAFCLTGKISPTHWSEKTKDVDFYTLKGMVETLLSSLHISSYRFEVSRHQSFHPGRQADVYFQNTLLGSMGEIHPKLLDTLGISERILFGEFSLNVLQELHQEHVRFTPIPNLPSSERDWTVSLKENSTIEPLFLAIDKHKPKILEKFELIDLYKPENATHKNVTFRFTYRDLLKTISAEEVETAHAKLLSSISAEIH